MTPDPILGDVEAIKALAARLSANPEVSRLDDREEPQSWTIAFTFSELEESVRKFLDELLPRLNDDALTPHELLSLLFEIGDAFRHIIHHLGDPQFYRYLLADHED